jgi:integral membrane protein
VDAAFRRYRLMSFITGTTLLSLFVTLALHEWALGFWTDIKPLVVIDGIGHGVVLYPIYLILSFQFVIKARLSLGYLAVMLLAGFVPGVAFAVEYFIAKRVYPEGIPPRPTSSSR